MKNVFVNRMKNLFNEIIMILYTMFILIIHRNIDYLIEILKNIDKSKVIV
jgi:hypothetical protein